MKYFDSHIVLTVIYLLKLILISCDTDEKWDYKQRIYLNNLQ